MKKKLFSFFILLGSAASLSAAINSNGSSSSWGNSGGWSCGCVPDMTKWDGSHDVNISHTKTRGGVTLTNNNILTVKSGGHLTVNGNLVIGYNGRLVVESGGTLVINGSISYTSGGSFNSSGNLTVNGNISITNNGSASFLGTTNVTGSVTQAGPGAFNTDGTFTVGTNLSINADGVATLDGDVTVPGDMSVWGSGGAIITGDVRVTGTVNVLNDSKVRGTGTIGWGSPNVNPACSPARIVCNNGSQWDNNACTAGALPMPGNPLDLTSCSAVVSCSVGSASSSPSVCINTVMTDITHTTSGVSGITSSVGLPPGVSAIYAGNQITISGTPSSSGVFNYTITPTGCATTATGTITVTDDRTVAAGSSSPTLCENTVLTDITHSTTGVTTILSSAGLPLGLSANYSGNTITISGTPTESGVFNYTITPDGCGSALATGTITVTGDRTVAAGSSSPTLCINTALTDITHSTTGVTTILSSSGLPSGLLADYSGNTITISGTPTESGIFNYTITPDGCGSEEANGTIIINDLPVVNLGNDTSICADSTLVIDVVVGVNWSWNTGETSQQITVDAEGDYDVMVTDGNGCINYDTVNVLVNPLPLVNLGNDTSICADSTITFDAEIGVDWSWNTGETSKQISVNTAGDLDVVVTDSNGCVNYDTVNLIIHALPLVDLGADTSICSNNSIIIGIEGDYEFEWNTLDTGRNILVFLANDYSLRVEDENGCVNYDTITIGVYDLPVVNIGEDTSICSGDTLEIDAVVGEQWEWSNGLTTQTILLTQAGDYSVTVTDTNGCENNDEMSLSMYELPLIDLGVDTAVCEEDSITLSIYSGTSWLWNNGATSSSVTVNFWGLFCIGD